MNKKIKDFFTKSRNRIRIIIPVEKLKILAVILIIICVGCLIHISSYDMILSCDKATNTCTISKKNMFDSTSIDISRFDTVKIYNVAVDKRKLENKKVIYDILLNYGPDNGMAFIDYGFTNPINANTVMVKFAKYLETNQKTLNISKHCYFNNYFCFVKGK